jgi:hypothetical protein
MNHQPLLILVLALWLLGAAGCSQDQIGAIRPVSVTVGFRDADVIGNDNRAIQKAIDQTSAAGGGTVTIKAGTYTLYNSILLASHITLKGEGIEKTILKKGPLVRSPLTVDADLSESQVTVEDTRGFTPGMGITVLDQGACQIMTGIISSNVRTIQRVEGLTLVLDRYLGLDYLVERSGEVSNSFPLIAGSQLEDVSILDLTADGNRSGMESKTELRVAPAAISFSRSKRFSIRNCVARNFAGDGICTAFVEEPVIENCEAYGNAYFGIHLGAGSLRGIVRSNRSHHNDVDGLYLCYRVQRGTFEANESWANGQDGISIGHKDTDNLFLRNVVHDNDRIGVYFRDEKETNAGHRNVLRENVIENNGRPGVPGYGVRIDGATRHITLDSNIIRETREGEAATQEVGIHIGPKADYITGSQNRFEGNLKRTIRDESKSANNKLKPATLIQSSVE